MPREKAIADLPTAAEIRARSREIRRGWSPSERESRCVGERAARKLVAIRRLMFDFERRFGVAEGCARCRLLDAANTSLQPEMKKIPDEAAHRLDKVGTFERMKLRCISRAVN